jgi:hypothetical protein
VSAADGGAGGSAAALALRCAFERVAAPAQAAVRYRGAGTCEVFLNGRPLRRLTSDLRNSKEIKVSYAPLRAEDLALFRRGRNVLAVRYVPADRRFPADISLVEVIEAR